MGILENGRGSLWECKRHEEAGKGVDFSKLSWRNYGEGDQALSGGLVVGLRTAPSLLSTWGNLRLSSGPPLPGL